MADSKVTTLASKVPVNSIVRPGFPGLLSHIVIKFYAGFDKVGLTGEATTETVVPDPF